MSVIQLDARSEAITTAHQYCRLLNTIEQMTDQLLSAIQSWNSDTVDAVMRSRVEIFQQIEHYVPTLLSQVSQARSQGNDSNSAELEYVLDKVQLLEQSVLGKQSACEEALAAEINSCKSDLLEFNKRRTVLTAYHIPANGGDARFLDSRQ